MAENPLKFANSTKKL